MFGLDEIGRRLRVVELLAVDTELRQRQMEQTLLAIVHNQQEILRLLKAAHPKQYAATTGASLQVTTR